MNPYFLEPDFDGEGLHIGIVRARFNDAITGNGDTRLSYQSSPTSVTVNLATGTASDGWGGTDSWTAGQVQEFSPWMQIWRNARKWVG